MSINDVIINDGTTIGTPEKPSKPWYRNWITWVVAGVIFIGGIVAAGLIVLSSPSGASGIVQGDGYKIVQTMTPEQLKASVNDKDASQYIAGDAAVGIKGTRMEVAAKLTDSGKTMVTAFMPMITAAAGHGLSGHVEGDYMVISGPASSFDNTGTGIFSK